METFGEWLRQQRDQRRLTREELAKRVGCSTSALRKIETGERRPSVQIAGLIANSLDIPSAEHAVFIRVARSELGTDRLTPVSNRVQQPQADSAPRNKLPILPTPLIGRQRELTELNQFLRDPQCRMLTCVGPGGMGKTRLAIEAATQLQDEFADGVYFIPLAPVGFARFIIPVIADALGYIFQNATPAEPKDQLLQYLKEKQVLLLVDNIEHLLKEPDIDWFAELIATAPHVKLLFTSREPVNLQGEWMFEVQGLPFPDRSRLDDATQDTAIELFLQRARRSHVGFTTTAEDYPAIVRICELVDGMPLGIELAAAWVRTLTCAEIEKEIQRSLDFLSLSSRDLPERHRSMRAVFEHSWNLLPDHERRALAYLSVFRGGFGRDAAEQVAGASLKILSALVSKSLVQRTKSERYDLHELIRQYAAIQLQEDVEAQPDANERHSLFYLNLLRVREMVLKNSSQSETMQELRSESGNIRIAWRWALAHENLALIAPAVQGLWLFYDIAGWFAEAVEMAEQTIQIFSNRLSGSMDLARQTVVGSLLAWQGWAYFRKGQYQQSRDLFLRSLPLLRQPEFDVALPQTLIMASVVTYRMGNLEKAIELVDEGLKLSEAIGNEWLASWALCAQGIIAGVQGKNEIAYERLCAGLAGYRKSGDPRLTAFALNYLSPIVITLDRQREAQTLLQESLTLSTQVGDKWGMGTAYVNLGMAALARKDFAEAQLQLRMGFAIFKELGAQGYLAQCLVYVGDANLGLGNIPEAKQTFREAARLALEVHSLPVALSALVGLAEVESQTEKALALELSSRILNHPAATQSTKDRAMKLSTGLQALTPQNQKDEIQGRASLDHFEEFVREVLKRDERN